MIAMPAPHLLGHLEESVTGIRVAGVVDGGGAAGDEEPVYSGEHLRAEWGMITVEV